MTGFGQIAVLYGFIVGLALGVGRDLRLKLIGTATVVVGGACWLCLIYEQPAMGLSGLIPLSAAAFAVNLIWRPSKTSH